MEHYEELRTAILDENIPEGDRKGEFRLLRSGLAAFGSVFVDPGQERGPIRPGILPGEVSSLSSGQEEVVRLLAGMILICQREVSHAG